MDAVNLFSQNKGRMLSVIRKWCRNTCDFNDILQNIFIKLHLHAGLFMGQSRVETWLYRVTVNECIDFYRKNRRFTENRVDISSVPVRDRAPSPDQNAEKREILERIRSIVETLDGHFRTIFKLYFYYGLGIPEIAGLFKVSHNTVRCRIYQAKEKVKKEARIQGLVPAAAA